MKQVAPKVVICEIDERDAPSGRDSDAYSPKVHVHALVNKENPEHKWWKQVYARVRGHFTPLRLSQFRSSDSNVLQNVYYSLMDEVPLEFVDISSDRAKTGKHWVHWYKFPYLFVFVVRCTIADRYRVYVRKILTDLVRYCKRKEFEHLILHVSGTDPDVLAEQTTPGGGLDGSSPDTPSSRKSRRKLKKKERKSRKRLRALRPGKGLFQSTIFERLRADFEKERLLPFDLDCYVPGLASPKAAQIGEKQSRSFANSVADRIVVEFVRRHAKIEAKMVQMRSKMSSASVSLSLAAAASAGPVVAHDAEDYGFGTGSGTSPSPVSDDDSSPPGSSQKSNSLNGDFSHFKFFILQESLALIFEQFGLFVEAIAKYHELKQMFALDGVKFRTFHDGNFLIARIISPDQKKYRQMVFEGEISEFDFAKYVFARQINLYFLMRHLDEVSRCTTEFVTTMCDRMLERIDCDQAGIRLDQKRVFVHAWAYCVARCVIEKAQLVVTRFQKEDEIRRLFRSMSDLYVVARCKLETLGRIFGMKIGFGAENSPFARLHEMIGTGALPLLTAAAAAEEEEGEIPEKTPADSAPPPAPAAATTDSPDVSHGSISPLSDSEEGEANSPSEKPPGPAVVVKPAPEPGEDPLDELSEEEAEEEGEGEVEEEEEEEEGDEPAGEVHYPDEPDQLSKPSPDSLVVYTSSYHFATRLTEALRDDKIFRTLHLELLHATRTSYKNGGRPRLFLRINRELASLRLKEDLFVETLLLLNRQARAYENERWYLPAVECRSVLARCQIALKRHGDAIQSLIWILMFHNLPGIPKKRCDEVSATFLGQLKYVKEETNFLLDPSLCVASRRQVRPMFSVGNYVKISGGDPFRFAMFLSNFLPRSILSAVSLVTLRFESALNVALLETSELSFRGKYFVSEFHVDNWQAFGMYACKAIRLCFTENFAIELDCEALVREIYKEKHPTKPLSETARWFRVLWTYFVIHVQPRPTSVRVNVKGTSCLLAGCDDEFVDVEFCCNQDAIKSASISLTAPQGCSGFVFGKNVSKSPKKRSRKSAPPAAATAAAEGASASEAEKGDLTVLPGSVVLRLGPHIPGSVFSRRVALFGYLSPSSPRNHVPSRSYLVECCVEYEKTSGEIYGLRKTVEFRFVSPLQQRVSLKRLGDLLYANVLLTSKCSVPVLLRHVPTSGLRGFECVEADQDSECVLHDSETMAYSFVLKEHPHDVKSERDYFVFEYSIDEDTKKAVSFRAPFRCRRRADAELEITLVGALNSVEYGGLLEVRMELLRLRNLTSKANFHLRIDPKRNWMMLCDYVERVVEFAPEEEKKVIPFPLIAAARRLGEVELPDVTVVGCKSLVRKSPSSVLVFPPHQKEVIWGYLSPAPASVGPEPRVEAVRQVSRAPAAEAGWVCERKRALREQIADGAEVLVVSRPTMPVNKKYLARGPPDDLDLFDEVPLQ